MATNYGIRIDLLKIKGSFVRNLKGKTATKRCIIIPVDETDGIFLGEKGCYLNMTAFELKNPQFEDTHCVKPNLPKEKRDAMTEEERKAIPILGGLHELAPQQGATMQVTGTLTQADFTGSGDSNEYDDLPF